MIARILVVYVLITSTLASPLLKEFAACSCCNGENPTNSTSVDESSTAFSVEMPCECCPNKQKTSNFTTPTEFLNERQPIQHQICPDGWKRHGAFCYHIELEKLNFDSAKLRCKEKNATVFQADNLDEWTEVIKMTPNSQTWTGIVQEVSEKASEGIVDPTKLNWLVKSFSPLSNGWSETSKCAAYDNVGRVALNYVHFYPCSNEYHSICKKKIGFHV